MTSTPYADKLKKADYSKPSAECDMVMKGGITSGVIYPLAVCELAIDHQLRNIGGASAGAIAAGAAAAAEYGRHRDGFRKLAGIPEKVGKDLDLLFQPNRRTRPAMRVLLAALRPGSVPIRIVNSIGSLVRWRLGWFLLGFAFVGGITLYSLALQSGLPRSPGGWLPLLRAWAPSAILLALPTGLVSSLIGLVVLVLRQVPKNYFGLTTGMTTGRSRCEALTPWLHSEIQNLAGRNLNDLPLTFGDLWGEEATARWRATHDESCPRDDSEAEEPLSPQKIALEVMTTNLTEGMPYRLPFEGRRFAFCEKCFAELFPAHVVARMVCAGVPPEPGDDGSAVCRLHDQPTPLLHLPPAPDFPVLVAVRMSLSFPLLISAVPLFKRDFNRKSGEHNWVPHWFSDGGIGSNFPIHLFDSPWPVRPTFGLDLQPIHPDFPDSKSYLRKQGHRAQPRTVPVARVTDLLGRVFTTMQNWRDSSHAMMPGYSDRIVTVYQGKDEGGMNLRMPTRTIEALAERGGKAAERLDAFEFDYHRWERYRIAMSELDRLLANLHGRYTHRTEQGQTSYQEFIADNQSSSFVPSQKWRDVDRENTEALMTVASDWINKGNQAMKDAPSPRPVLRLESRQIESRADQKET